MITSAALYYEPEPHESVPLYWLDQAIDFFSGHRLRTTHYQLMTSDHVIEAVTDFTSENERLMQTLRERHVHSLALYSELDCGDSGEDWLGMASIDLAGGMIYLGIKDNVLSQTSVLIRQLLEMPPRMVSVRYGIAYKRPISKGPESYAAGVWVCSLFDVLENLPERSSVSKWLNERQSTRHFLHGLFRGAYPASILSTDHIRLLQESVGPLSHIPGTLTAVREELWLWELSDQELPKAEELLQKNGLLV